MKNPAGEEMPVLSIETKDGKTTHEFNYIDPNVQDYFRVFVGLLAQQGWDTEYIYDVIREELPTCKGIDNSSSCD